MGFDKIKDIGSKIVSKPRFVGGKYGRNPLATMTPEQREEHRKQLKEQHKELMRRALGMN